MRPMGAANRHLAYAGHDPCDITFRPDRHRFDSTCRVDGVYHARNSLGPTPPRSVLNDFAPDTGAAAHRRPAWRNAPRAASFARNPPPPPDLVGVVSVYWTWSGMKARPCWRRGQQASTTRASRRTDGSRRIPRRRPWSGAIDGDATRRTRNASGRRLHAFRA